MKIPELPKTADIIFLPFNEFALDGSSEKFRAFALGAIKMRDEHAAKHREAAVVAIEALTVIAEEWLMVEQLPYEC